MQSKALVWILLFPLIGATLLPLLRHKLSVRQVGLIGSTTIALGFVTTVVSLLSYIGAGDTLVQNLFLWAPTADINVHFGLLGDAISLWWLVVITGVGLLIHIYSAEYMRDDPGMPRFFAKLNYFVFAMSVLVLADNFIGLLIGWAQVGVASFMLIGFWNFKPEAAAAAKKAFVINYVGEVGMLIGLMLMFVHFRSFAYSDVFGSVGLVPTGAITAIALLLLIGAVAKSAQLPLHTWLPDAMQGPTPVSALMHAATMVTAGVYLVVRAFPLFTASAFAMQTVAVIGAVTALFGAIVATKQFDIKRVLAFSTMSQLGYMMLGAGVGAYTASVFHFFTHAFFKALLFLGAGLIAHYLHGEQDIRRMGGLRKKQPFAYWTFLIGVLAIAGAPPLAGFFSKDEILGAVIQQGHPILWLIGIVTAGLTAFYMFRLLLLVFAGQPAGEMKDPGFVGHESGVLMKAPMIVLTVLAAVSGLIAIPGVTSVPESFLGPAFIKYGHAIDHVVEIWPIVVVLVVAFIGTLFAFTRYGSSRQGRGRAIATYGKRPVFDPIGQAFYADLVYQKVIGGIVVGLGTVVAILLEPFVIDGAVNGIASLAGKVSQGVSRIHSGFVRRYALTMLAGFAIFLIYFILI